MKKVTVLMFDENGSGENGQPVAVFQVRPKYADLLDEVGANSVREVGECFKEGRFWLTSVAYS
jgi:hypothetical protein